MKNIFHAYLKPSENEFRAFFDNFTLVVDTNILLNFYRYSESTRNQLIHVLEKYSDNLWIPYHVGQEFFNGRVGVINKIFNSYAELIQTLTSAKEKLISTIKNDYSRHPLIENNVLVDDIEKQFSQIIFSIESTKSKHPDLLKSDDILEKILTLFNGKVGEKFTDAALEQIYKEGEYRYAKKIPPGYMDDKKESNTKYGDLVIWKEILNYSQKSGKNIAFITDDDKEDWWHTHSGKTIGPRPELINEFLESTKNKVYIYKPDQFINIIPKETLKVSDKEITDATDEIKELRERSHGLFAFGKSFPNQGIQSDLWKKLSGLGGIKDFEIDAGKSIIDFNEKAKNFEFYENLKKHYEWQKDFVIPVPEYNDLLKIYFSDIEKRTRLADALRKFDHTIDNTPQQPSSGEDENKDED